MERERGSNLPISDEERALDLYQLVEERYQALPDESSAGPTLLLAMATALLAKQLAQVNPKQQGQPRLRGANSRTLMPPNLPGPGYEE